MLEDNTEQWVRFRLPCACHSNEHDLTVDLEYMSDIDIIELHFYYQVCTRIYKTWWKEQLHKWKLVWKLIFKGYIETEGDFLFPDDRAMLDFLHALTDSMKHLHERNRGEEEEGVSHK